MNKISRSPYYQQNPDTTGQQDMHDSAIESGCIDLIISPDDFDKEIIQISRSVSKTTRMEILQNLQ